MIDFGGQEIRFNSARKEKRIVLELRERGAETREIACEELVVAADEYHPAALINHDPTSIQPSGAARRM